MAGYYVHGSLKGDPKLLQRLEDAARRVVEGFNKLDMAAAGVSEYNQKYVKPQFSNHRYSMQTYTYPIWECFKDGDIPLEKATFVEYGGGAGRISLLAKALGVGTVVYNDIYDVSCDDARKIATAMGLAADHYVCGDIADLVSYAQTHGLLVNRIASHDVIEHIYNVPAFFQTLRGLPRERMVLCFSSGANIHCVRQTKHLRRKHMYFELQDRPEVVGHKKRDALKSYRSIRKEIILARAPELDEPTAARLAQATRGLIKADIEACVDEFRKTGAISYQPDDPTNTCDPLTGNWAEHLMPTPKLRQMVLDGGAREVQIIPVNYCHHNNAAKRAVGAILNAGIGLLGSKGLLLAGTYALRATYDDLAAGATRLRQTTAAASSSPA